MEVPVGEDAIWSRLLVAEDNYQADVAANDAEAIEALDRIPQAVVMDCQMPLIDGYAATAAIREAEGPSRHVPIIAMTASAMEGERERCLPAGMDDYMSKPINRHLLAATLERWIASGAVRLQSADRGGVV